MNILVTATKGVKIHLQSTEVVEPALQVLKGMKGQLKQPIFLHADMFVGPNMPAGAAIVEQVALKVIFICGVVGDPLFLNCGSMKDLVYQYMPF